LATSPPTRDLAARGLKFTVRFFCLLSVAFSNYLGIDVCNQLCTFAQWVAYC
jgi:hypothetical protein